MSLDVGLSDDILGVSLLNGLGMLEGLSPCNCVVLTDLIEAVFDLSDDRFGLGVGGPISAKMVKSSCFKVFRNSIDTFGFGLRRP